MSSLGIVTTSPTNTEIYSIPVYPINQTIDYDNPVIPQPVCWITENDARKGVFICENGNEIRYEKYRDRVNPSNCFFHNDNQQDMVNKVATVLATLNNKINLLTVRVATLETNSVEIKTKTNSNADIYNNYTGILSADFVKLTYS